jgi:hypothetical protein
MSASKLPDWAAAIAAEAPPPREARPDQGWQVLLSELLIRVRPDGSLEKRRRVAGQALIGGERPVGLGLCPFTESTKIRSAAAWHLHPDGSVRRGKRGFIDILVSDSFVSDTKTRIYPLDDVVDRSLVFFEFEVREIPPALTHLQSFYGPFPVAVSRLIVELPPRWSLLHDWLRIDGPDPRIDGLRSVWELRDLPGISKSEELGPAWDERSPWLVLSFVSPAEAPPEHSASFGTWKDMALWYESLVGRRDAPTPDIEAVWSESAGEPSTFGNVVYAGRYVRDRVRYVAREIGIGSYQPRPAGQVLIEKLGDCKDKGILLEALLASRSIRSYPILIHATENETVSPSVPVLQSFDHYVVGVSLPEGETLPDTAAARIRTDGLGELVVVDSTDETTPVGRLPSYLAGKTGLLVAGAHSGLVTLPADRIGQHQIDHRLDITPDDDDGVVIFEKTTLLGDPAAARRRLWRESPGEYRAHRERELRSRWRDVQVESFQVQDEDAEGRFIESIRYQGSLNPGGRLIGLFPSAVRFLERVSIRDRQQDVVYPHTLVVRFESRVHGLTRQFVPEPFERQGEGWSVQSSYDNDGDVLVATWAARRERNRFPPESFPVLEEFWDAARDAAAVAIPYGR